jgi:GntR family transcriptional regulator, transcriptional repressor for pyruvate dehydrogenase complex
MDSLTAIFMKDTTPSVQQVRASDAAHDLLRSLIHSGELGPGELLPPERNLASYLGISRTALREALRVLEAETYVVIRVGAKGGTRVADIPTLERIYISWLQTNSSRVNEIAEVLVVLEKTLAALAAQRCMPEDLARLNAARISPNLAGAELVRSHTDFHAALAICAHNTVIADMVAKLRREVFFPIGFLDAPRRVRLVEEHERILAAVRDRDPEAAANEMGRHMPIEHLSEREWEPAPPEISSN